MGVMPVSIALVWVSCRTCGLLDLCSGDVPSWWWGNGHPVPTA